MTLAQAAQRAIQLGGAYDGHELPPDINKFTVVSAKALAGQGLLAVAKDKYPHDGNTFSFVATFAEIEADVETGQYRHFGFPRLCRRWHRAPSAELWAARFSAARSWALVTPSARNGSTTSIMAWPLSRRFHHTKPPTILDIPDKMAWAAVEIPDPETPIGARGIGEPPVGGGCARF